ncbi:glutamine ABC transporter ATP-binding protein [Pseudomonas daroniae]|uniref:Glutamine ABC transporter ATP-binding protein n=1 Tax=Phytopseudomonas daroniae TaxID=2487519 RepID=A0A4Q9QG54_9GAMM|nr:MULTISPECIES: amino acid ABC transporter ATP-binding protein [Pseudomonas]TBU72411.1 glutamine ABC transporter ATP-binding protein [Pseudomonas daroniae]TBU74265.1 glutamine ABC transporter ATP-binding protein [Pseudomonas sp. FRB 228]TBU86525.1 glutamine ABC transporter ATP-binding protein [Pseudomonas daroniae]
MIEIRGVRKQFGNIEILKGIDLDVHKSELLCLLGASGSGKSTLLQCINALEPIQGGHIKVDGIDVHDRKTDLNKLRQKLGIVFQQFNAFPHLTALENVALAPRLVAGKSRREASELAASHLEHVGLGGKADLLPSRLSGGQQQRLAIARALAMKPSYMLFDEVTSALDPELVGEVLDTMRMLRKEGMTMVVVTHDIAFARNSSDRVAFLHSGTVAEIGTVAQVLGQPTSEHTQKFLRREHH